MPYITHEARVALRTRFADSPGELNYQLTTVIIEYMHAHRLSYQTINDIVGALEGAKLEFNRRVVAPYEDSKAEMNGDLYAYF